MADPADLKEYLATLENHAEILCNLAEGLEQLHRFRRKLLDVEAQLPLTPEGVHGKTLPTAGRAVIASVIDDQLEPAIITLEVAVKALASELQDVGGVSAGGLMDAKIESACAESRRLSLFVRQALGEVSEKFLKIAGARLIAVADLPTELQLEAEALH
jgi:hypothetical protein